MADRTRNANGPEPLRICVQRFGVPEDMAHAAGWCVAGIALVTALACLIAPWLGAATTLLAIPAVLVVLGFIVVGFICMIGAPILWLAARFARFRPGSLRVENGLVIDQGGIETTLPLTAVTRATLSAREDELALRMRDGDVVRAQVRGRKHAEAILDAIAAGKAHGTWLSSLGCGSLAPTWTAWPWLCALGATFVTGGALLALVGDTGALSFAVITGAAVRVAAAYLGAPGATGSVVLGKDGVALKTARMERFIAFTSIERIDETDTGASLVLRGGEVIAVDIRQPPRPEAEPAGSLTAALAARRREQLLALLREGILPGGQDVVRSGALLERRGRTARAWREALSELVREAAGGYRTATLPREQALAVLEDGRAPSELRIGAALALTSGSRRVGEHETPRGLDPDTVARLRIAVETCVNQDVRTALRDAIYGELEDDTLDRAMAPGPARPRLARG